LKKSRELERMREDEGETDRKGGREIGREVWGSETEED